MNAAISTSGAFKAGQFDLSTKFAYGHAYASTNPLNSDDDYAAVQAHATKGIKLWNEIRNDDIFVFRFGNPDFVRDFLHNTQYEVTGKPITINRGVGITHYHDTTTIPKHDVATSCW